jgi:hypothetical protein
MTLSPGSKKLKLPDAAPAVKTATGNGRSYASVAANQATLGQDTLDKLVTLVAAAAVAAQRCSTASDIVAAIVNVVKGTFGLEISGCQLYDKLKAETVQKVVPLGSQPGQDG